MSEDKLTLCSSIEACARANATALGILEHKIKLAMAEGEHHKVVGLIAEYNQEQRLVMVAKKRAMKILQKRGPICGKSATEVVFDNPVLWGLK